MSISLKTAQAKSIGTEIFILSGTFLNLNIYHRTQASDSRVLKSRAASRKLYYSTAAKDLALSIIH